MSRRATRQAQTSEQRLPRDAATKCECGTWRTPGLTHSKGDTGVTPNPPISSEWCSK